MEQELIELIANARTDSDALESLFKQYRGVANAVTQKFHLVGMTRDDWASEALQVMHKACFKYDAMRGSQFGPYYRFVLVKHFKTVTRRAKAKRREAQLHTLPIGNLPDEMELGCGINEMGNSLEEYVAARIMIPMFLHKLSNKELAAVRDWVAGDNEHDHSNARARERVRAKWAKFIADQG